MKLGHKILMGTAGILTANTVYTVYRIMKAKGFRARGNADCYLPDSPRVHNNNLLTGKRILFLGSSVTYGTAAQGNSFVEYLQAWDGVIPVKEAVGGTLLVEQKNGKHKESYITRLKRIPQDTAPDMVLCQLSTNDATMRKPLGTLSSDGIYDTQTVTGAIEYIISYVRETWGCPVVFYTGTKYKSVQYEAMVSRLLEVQRKWNIDVIDLWNDTDMNSVSQADYSLYMNDPIHPTMAGYSRWWLPKIRTGLIAALEKEASL